VREGASEGASEGARKGIKLKKKIKHLRKGGRETDLALALMCFCSLYTISNKKRNKGTDLALAQVLLLFVHLYHQRSWRVGSWAQRQRFS